MSNNKGQKVERDRLEMEGTVISGSNAQFKVQTDAGMVVLCSLSGKIRENGIRILVSDRVVCEVSEYDPTRGRIIYRLK